MPTLNLETIQGDNIDATLDHCGQLKILSGSQNPIVLTEDSWRTLKSFVDLQFTHQMLDRTLPSRQPAKDE